MELAKEFLEMVNKFHAHPELYDDELKKQILKHELEILENPKVKFPPRDFPYFSPSSAKAMELELYMKVLKQKRDDFDDSPHKKRWTKIGEAVGTTLQQDLLAIEKHSKKILGKEKPPFRFLRTKENYPAYEEFIKIARKFTHREKSFYLFGRPDGVMEHTETNELVGLEVKSKSTTYSKTSPNAMKEASPDHILQCVCYSLMYGTQERPINKFIIVYWNVTKKAWEMTEDDLEKYPDLRVFEVEITDEMREEVLDKFARVLEAAEKKEKPQIDLGNFTFCSYKQVIAEQMTEEEWKEVKQQVKDIQKKNLPQYKKQPYIDAFMYIKEVRELKELPEEANETL